MDYKTENALNQYHSANNLTKATPIMEKKEQETLSKASEKYADRQGYHGMASAFRDGANWQKGQEDGLLDQENDIDTVGKCANCGVEFHIHKAEKKEQGCFTREDMESLIEFFTEKGFDEWEDNAPFKHGKSEYTDPRNGKTVNVWKLHCTSDKKNHNSVSALVNQGHYVPYVLNPYNHERTNYYSHSIWRYARHTLNDFRFKTNK